MRRMLFLHPKFFSEHGLDWKPTFDYSNLHHTAGTLDF